MIDYRLTDLSTTTGALPRTLHGLATRSPLRFLRRVAEVGAEFATAAVLDRLAPERGGVTEEAPGAAPVQGTALALYLHWSPDGRISAMVRRQLALWRGCGFDVVFITNAHPPAEDWEAVTEHSVLRLRRPNAGRDFGAWRDGIALALARLPAPQEVLLTNDSILGPFLPLEPLVDAWRAGGEGLFGMTESHGGGVHLQSYALLARGAGPVASLLEHLAGYRDSRSKWRVVQRGEIGLTRHMQAAGHRCAALFGYARLCDLVDDETRASLGPRFAAPGALLRYPLNPTHHLWRVLVERMGFPYLKRELVLRNPGRLPGVADWPALVPGPDAALIHDHLRVMAGGATG